MLVFGEVYCVMDNGLDRYQRNLQVIRPYCNGPPLYRYFPDCVAAVAGMVYRRGLIEFTSSFALMFIINPWIKYWVCGNIYTSELKERFVTQVGSPLDDMTPEQVATSFRKYISRTKNREDNRQYIHNVILFCPHFPFPRGQKRKWAVGLEHSTIACFVHTIHFQGNPVKPECFSRSADVPVYRVILWRNNPYHIYTGGEKYHTTALS